MGIRESEAEEGGVTLLDIITGYHRDTWTTKKQHSSLVYLSTDSDDEYKKIYTIYR